MDQKARHLASLGRVAERVKADPNVIALLLSGSVAYGTVWEKSDLDLTMIVRDNAGVEKNASDYCLDEGGVEVHLAVMEMADFKRAMQQRAGGRAHSYFSMGRLVFSKDDSLYGFFDEAKRMGKSDTALAFIDNAEMLISYMNRAEKWAKVVGDSLYAQRFLSECATYMANMILLYHGEEPNRESILRAMELEPEVMRPLYEAPFSGRMTREEVLDCVKKCDDFLLSRAEWWSAPLRRYLADGEAKSVSQAIKYFQVSNLFAPLAYLADKGILVRVTRPARVFRHSKFLLDEVAYLDEGQPE